MSLSFSAPVYWDAFVDEFRGVWEVAKNESQLLGENKYLEQNRVNIAAQMIIRNPEMYDRFKGKIYLHTLTGEEIAEIRKILGYTNHVLDTRNKIYG